MCRGSMNMNITNECNIFSKYYFILVILIRNIFCDIHIMASKPRSSTILNKLHFPLIYFQLFMYKTDIVKSNRNSI